MKRILLLTTVFMMMLGTSFSSAQTDADNFYKSDLVSVEKVSFSNQYKTEGSRKSVSAQEHERRGQIPCNHCRTSNGSCQGTERESLRNENGRTGFCNTLHRPVFLGWE